MNSPTTDSNATSAQQSYAFTVGSGYQLPTYPFVKPPELSGGATHRYPVVIVGAGITGLTMACALAKLGIEAVLLDEAAAKFLNVAATRLGWSGRSTHRALKVARTIADLAGAHSTQVAHVAEAMQYRQALRGAL